MARVFGQAATRLARIRFWGTFLKRASPVSLEWKRVSGEVIYFKNLGK